MAVKLRLRREGTKRQAHYRVVAADSRAPRDGRFLEILGEYHPMEDPSGIRIDAERALHWLRNGARPTDAVQQLLYISGVWEEFRPGTTPDDVTIQPPSEPESDEQAPEPAEASGDAASSPAEDESPSASADTTRDEGEDEGEGETDDSETG